MANDILHPTRIAAAHSFALVLSLLALQAGCSGFVEVGEGQGDGDGDGDNVSGDGGSHSGDGGSHSGDGDSTEPLDCADEEAERKAGYDQWKAAPNDFGELVGKTYKGYIEGDADVTLIIDEDGSAQFIVGDAAPPPTDRAAGYLCEDAPALRCAQVAQEPPVDGGTYEVHNATFDGARLRVPLPDRAAYDQWCALQNPKRTGDDQCLFDLMGNTTVGFGESGCQVGTEEVDCAWFDLAFEGAVCDCTSTECFAADVSLERQLEIDARVAEQGFEGSFLAGEESRTIYLFEEE